MPSSVVTRTIVRQIPATVPGAIKYGTSSGAFAGQASMRAIRLTVSSSTILGFGAESEHDRYGPLPGAAGSQP